MKNDAVDWQSYATAYDLMADNNPAYQAILSSFCKEFAEWSINDGDIIVEMGAGTGNFSTCIASQFPQASVVHVDSDQGMNAKAKQKAFLKQCRNMNFQEEQIENISFPDQSISAIICVHSIYTFIEPLSTLRKIAKWLKPGGYIFICDLGRLMSVSDWKHYLFRENYQRQGFLRTLHLFWKARAVAKANHSIRESQLSGKFWLHDLAEMEEVIAKAGFRITRSEVVYRGYSDLVMGVKL
jgi:ubiquinone/menaquinone biosynthesis C-methylase UbiE